MKKTPLYEAHVALKARMVPFADYLMPLHYGSQIAEHDVVRTSAGMFDVSHMMVTDVVGVEAKSYLRYLLSNDVAKLDRFLPGKALYTLMLNEAGGIVDDLIAYRLSPTQYRLVSNAGTRDKVRAWLATKAVPFSVSLQEKTDWAMIAVQGPQTMSQLMQLKPTWTQILQQLGAFQGLDCDGFFVSRTGYTGEEGVEIMGNAADITALWTLLLGEVVPCGLAARDTLRLEAGMHLYGEDMDENTLPCECGLTWVVDEVDTMRDFVGKKALSQKAATCTTEQVGLILQEKGVLRHGYGVNIDGGEGIITSGSFSPTLNLSIALARIPIGAPKNKVRVNIRGHWVSVTVVSLPFVRHGKAVFKSQGAQRAETVA